MKKMKDPDIFSDPAPITAYIDMEFGGVYGTYQRMNIPIEIGTLLYNPESDEIDLSGKKFRYDIDVEQWLNKTDDWGRTKGVKKRIFNLENSDSQKEYDKKFHLDAAGRKKAHKISGIINYDLNVYMQHLLERNIKTLVFYAKNCELQIFERAKVDLSNVIIRDLQKEIKDHYELQNLRSLDRLSYLVNFKLSNQKISSDNYTYSIPERFRYLIKPHKAIGDAARMFLLSKEFYHHADELKKKIQPAISLVKKSGPFNEKQELKDF
jgi:hypothetical protein